MTLVLRQNFVCAMYLENKLADLYKISLYAFILTRSMKELLLITFCTFVPELLHLIYAKFSFLLNILGTN